MKRFFFLLVFLVCFANFAAAQEYNETDVLKLRKLREEQFRNRGVSPLRPSDFSTFENLNYYSIAPVFCISAIFEETPAEKAFMMPTSNGLSHKYRKIGILKFDLNGKNFSLAAYRREYETTDSRARQINKDLFIPFKDLTNGTETYSGGRYVFARVSEGSKETLLDFNLAVNPSCAYGDPSFSCPIPPKENFLQAEVKAGEKIYKNYGAAKK